MMRPLLAFATIFTTASLICLNYAHSSARSHQEFLIKTNPGLREFTISELENQKVRTQKISDNWYQVRTPKNFSQKKLQAFEGVVFVQPNYEVKLLEDLKIQDPLRREALKIMLARSPKNTADENADKAETREIVNNPDIPENDPEQSKGIDPLLPKQWGLTNIRAEEAWKVSKGQQEIIVAVIDTGVDYTHLDLLANLWRNTGEIPNNGIDDDNNGYIDDVIGWDFIDGDNKPYDFAVDSLDGLFKGGNPGHGTHCAGNIAARGDNTLGISGVAPFVKIMPVRFLGQYGGGTTADAVRAIKYAVDNGAKVLNNSWGSEGEDGQDKNNLALREIIKYAEDKSVLFIAAAGNGHGGIGYDNDSDPRPAYPASYPHDNIISVTAINIENRLGSFANWGKTTVDLAAPGVNILSTVINNEYSDTIFDRYGIKISWDGTSMAAPHVAGATALYWSINPDKSWKEVKQAILNSTTPTESVKNKTVSGGKLNLDILLRKQTNDIN